MSDSYLEIQLDHQPIELCKLLKIADLVSGGGEAKVVISEGYVLLNGEVEYQKRKKVYHNDIVEFNGEVIQVIINENLNDDGFLTDISDEKPFFDNTKRKPHDNYTSNAESNKNNQKKAATSKEDTAKQNKRKPIVF